MAVRGDGVQLSTVHLDIKMGQFGKMVNMLWMSGAKQVWLSYD